MKTRTPFLSVLLALLLGALVLLSPSCNGCTCPLKSVELLSCSDGSEVTLAKGTDISPTCACMDADYVPLSSLPDPACLPCNPEWAKDEEGEETPDCIWDQAKSIVAIDVTPDGKTLTPAGQLSYKLPTKWPGQAGDKLYIFQHDPGAICNPSAYKTSWKPVWTEAAKVTSGLDRAIGKFNHTCIFLLVDLQGDFDAMGTVTRPLELEPDDTLFVSLDVVNSSTHPEVEGQAVTFGLYGVQYGDGIQALLSLMMEYFPPGTTLLIHHETDGNTLIWSDSQVIQFDCEGVGW